jgi:uncharacterized protein (TIGR02246 family)
MIRAEEKKALEALIFAYGQALNEGNSKRFVSLYTEDGVFVPRGYAPCEGREQIEKFLSGFFTRKKLEFNFYIQEIEIMNDEYAWVLSHSRGQEYVIAENQYNPQANEELFLMKKVNQEWKIKRYIFNDSPGGAVQVVNTP